MVKLQPSLLILAFALFLTEPGSVLAQDQPRMRPLDFYIAVFGGGNLPSKTDVTEIGPGTCLTVMDVELKQSASLGGKIGMYTTSFRAMTGLDVGAELDVTTFSPDQKGNQRRNARGTLAGIPVMMVVTNPIDISIRRLLP